jgi:hypothetical protein
MPILRAKAELGLQLVLAGIMLVERGNGPGK